MSRNHPPLNLDQVLPPKMHGLFSAIIVFDDELKIIYSSETLQRHMPQLSGSPQLTEIFEIKRPRTAATFEQMRESEQSLFLMIARDNSFAIRGQIIDLSEGQSRHLCFLGAPWLSWLHGNSPEINLNLDDFTPQDSQMDQLFYISTEKRMVEDLEQLNRQLKATTAELESAQAVKNAFFAQLSHEMRTPLNGVISALTLLRDQGLTGQSARLLNLARESSQNLMDVINYVLDISKIEHTEALPEKVLFDLPELAASVIDVVRARAIEKNLDIHSHINGRLPTQYLGDVAKLRQALLNLVINAIKFTERGAVTLKVQPSTLEGMTLRIEVCDTGIGIAEHDQAVIFKPFHRLQNKVSIDLMPGTGLGLDIARRNIEFMGGSMGVESTEGAGSTFWLELPCPVAKHQDAAVDTQLPSVKESPQIEGRILLVDDNETNLLLGGMILESLGVQVIPVNSGEKAVEIAREEQPDMVLMDISMPGIDGFEATRRIRTFRDSTALPIVALTAFANSAEREQSASCGMNDYLTKPIDRDQLAKVLSTWLSGTLAAPQDTAHPTEEGYGGQVDHAVLDELKRQIGRDNLLTVLDKFLNEVECRWQAVESAGSKDELSREAHTLASTCRSFGLPMVADKLACIERHARFGDVENPPCIAETGRQLQEGTKTLRSALEVMRGQP